MEPTAMEMRQQWQFGVTIGGVGMAVILLVVAVFVACKYKDRVKEKIQRKGTSEGQEKLMETRKDTDNMSEVVMA